MKILKNKPHLVYATSGCKWKAEPSQTQRRIYDYSNTALSFL
jgi:hypothetical protein